MKLTNGPKNVLIIKTSLLKNSNHICELLQHILISRKFHWNQRVIKQFLMYKYINLAIIFFIGPKKTSMLSKDIGEIMMLVVSLFVDTKNSVIL